MIHAYSQSCMCQSSAGNYILQCTLVIYFIQFLCCCCFCFYIYTKSSIASRKVQWLFKCFLYLSEKYLQTVFLQLICTLFSCAYMYTIREHRVHSSVGLFPALSNNSPGEYVPAGDHLISNQIFLYSLNSFQFLTKSII